ncbi:MAG: DinB family protein [Acidobacteriota bacterium]|nr:DinB family protein [Acidobacteriota bacterium]
MKRYFLAAVLLCIPVSAQQTKPFTLRAHLLAELKSTHNVKDWFVPANDAVAGLSAKDAAWTDGSGNHSVGMLANHLVFWDRRALQQIKGEKVARFDGNNDETFNAFNEAQWAEIQKQLDSVLTDIETYVETVDEAELEKNASTLSHIATHNAYHVGQMLYVRKLHGVWNPAQGVK